MSGPYKFLQNAKSLPEALDLTGANLIGYKGNDWVRLPVSGLDPRVRTTVGSSFPSDPKTGDIHIWSEDSGSRKKWEVYRYTGTAWSKVLDPPDGRGNLVTIGASAPSTGAKTGDLHLLSAASGSNSKYDWLRYNGTAWVLALAAPSGSGGGFSFTRYHLTDLTQYSSPQLPQATWSNLATGLSNSDLLAISIRVSTNNTVLRTQDYDWFYRSIMLQFSDVSTTPSDLPENLGQTGATGDALLIRRSSSNLQVMNIGMPTRTDIYCYKLGSSS